MKYFGKLLFVKCSLLQRAKYLQHNIVIYTRKRRKPLRGFRQFVSNYFLTYFSSILQQATIPLISDKDCKSNENYESINTTNVFCAGEKGLFIHKTKLSLFRTFWPSLMDWLIGGVLEGVGQPEVPGWTGCGVCPIEFAHSVKHTNDCRGSM